jgi:amino acid adenylation domain-containing protein
VTTLSTSLDVAAERDGAAPAIQDRSRAWTWAEAAEAAGRIGAALDTAGVRRGDRVGVHYRKSAEAFLAMHAVVRHGAVAVPLDPTAPASYLASIVRHTGCDVILTHEACRPSALSLTSAGVRALIGLDPAPAGTDARTGTAAVSIAPDEIAGLDPVGPAPARSDDLAYIITTSGSTGVPKGIGHTHRSASAYVECTLAAYDLHAGDRVSDIAPNHFDISTMALWVTPAVGATNIVVPEPFQMLPASLSKLAEDEAITIWYSVPYLLTQLLDRGDLEHRDLSALRWVLFGGEVFPQQVLARLMARLPGARFSNVYGPAEVNACTVHHLDGPPCGKDPVPIGRPLSGADVALVEIDDPTPGVEPPSGGQGEIWVSAPTMMAGYWRRPDLDAAAIVTGADGRRWYRTGDVGYRLPSGELVFSGRIDHQVKVRGHRVELEAIESVLESATGVASAVATVARRGDGADVVVAGLVARQGEVVDLDAVRRHAAEHLPAYALPASLEAIDDVRTTGSGKLDRRRLRADLAARNTKGTL